MEGRLKRYFPVLIVLSSAILLAGFGLVCLYSALRGSFGIPVNIFSKQLILLMLSLGFGTMMAVVKEDNLRNWSFVAMIVSFVMLLVVLIPGIGVKVNGARRWLELGFTRVQVSEIAKVFFVIGFAQYLSHFQTKKSHFWYGFVFPMAIIGAFVGVILLEPDYGSAFLFGIVGMTMLYLWGTPLVLLLMTKVAGAGAFLYLIYQDPVRWKRITSFLDIEGNKSDGAYQLYQGLLAFGSGGWFGLGIGNGRQQLAYLPEAHTDFIFPVIAEELGLFATLGILGLFAALFGAVLIIAARLQSMFWFLATIGGGCFIIYQCLFNIGVVTGLLPTKGISLPFISYGGANLMASFFIVGLLVNAWRTNLKMSHIPVREL